VAAIVTRDTKRASRFIVLKMWRARYSAKTLAHRAHRRIEAYRLRLLGDDYEATWKPRLTGWDLY
jgi:hypothetical protein